MLFENTHKRAQKVGMARYVPRGFDLYDCMKPYLLLQACEGCEVCQSKHFRADQYSAFLLILGTNLKSMTGFVPIRYSQQMGFDCRLLR